MNAQITKSTAARRKHKLTAVSTLHYVKLVYRSALFLAALGAYLYHRIAGTGRRLTDEYILLGIIWLVYAVEMVLRFFPSKLESPGCQKQFARNYQPTGKQTPQLQSWKRTLAVAAAWIALNSVIGILYFTDIIDKGILILISLAYGVCDMICILFFCPFQTWFMKNRCCTDCRIYNWDFAMMFTPLVFIPNLYTWSLCLLSLLLLLRWEITLKLHPERFSRETNACISCKNCTEKLCKHKKQLQIFLKKHEKRFRKSKK